MPRRPSAASRSTPLAILAAIALVLGLLGAYAHRAVFDSEGFSDRATAALRDPDVRALLARDVTDKLVLANEADLIAARPLIESVVSGFLGSAAFATVFRAAVDDVHRAVFSGDANTVTLTLRDVGTVAAAGLRIADPRAAAKLEGHRDVTVEADAAAFMADAARTADRVRLLALVLLGLAVLLGAAALLVARDRRRTAFQLGAAVAVGGVLVVFALVLARGIVVRAVDGTEEEAAARGVWE
ncbi:MAG TPA: hypothetical protein VLA98_01995, partial [Solirubrobacteraceae bacterium]|nr:hypothetical protein [Solirubrobacteraceae bacterium]